MFRKAVSGSSYLRMALTGPAGSGKSYTALSIATNLTDKRVAVIDTENGSASKYGSLFDFDVLELDAPYHPDRFIEAITDATKAGYGVVVIDSLSHAWNGAGGILELVDGFAKRSQSTNTFAAWKDATPIQNRLVSAIVGAKLHLIATMRSKTEYVIEKVERGNRTINMPRKIGTAPVQRDQFEYEFDVVGDLDQENNLIITKSRCPELSGEVVNKAGGQVAGVLRGWLGGEVRPVAEPVKPQEPMLTEKRAEAMMRELAKLGYDQNAALELVAETVRKGVVSLTELTDAQALEVWNAARKGSAARLREKAALEAEKPEWERWASDEQAQQWGAKSGAFSGGGHLLMLAFDAVRKEVGEPYLPTDLYPAWHAHVTTLLEGQKAA